MKIQNINSSYILGMNLNIFKIQKTNRISIFWKYKNYECLYVQTPKDP